MNLSEIITISGKPGLYKLISKGKNNFIVESLIDKKRIPAFTHDGISSLDNIAIYTINEEVALSDIFEAIYKKENGDLVPDIMKDTNRMKDYFVEVLPEYDQERVFPNSIKKILNWYNILNSNNLIGLPSAVETQEPEEDNSL
ncbi:MAG: DUF5606 domain-containing protein [Bacteroidales bacterium]|nr:DUF5606 domain-containing protein [Bacteroidales bacterium]